MSILFISHSSKDNDTASEVLSMLLKQDFRSVFLDFDPENGIPAGRDWEKELYSRLSNSSAVIVLCSEHSMASPWCFTEIAMARSMGKYIFPIKIDHCRIIPLLGDIQLIDFTKNETEGYQRLLASLKNVALDSADLFGWDGTRPPYPGLMAFQEQDAAVYFGRDKDIQRTIETLNRLQHFKDVNLALVLGASGSGKSSLVRAGVIPRLKRDKDRWLVIEPFRPLDRPFDQLAMVIACALSSFGKATDWKTVHNKLMTSAGRDKSDDLLELLYGLRIAAGQINATIVIVIDQFEELLGPDIYQIAHPFLLFLQAMLKNANNPLLILATLRSDFLGVFQVHQSLQNLKYQPINLPQMTLDNFSQVIEGPAKTAGIKLMPGLTQRMVIDTAVDDALPLLAFTLREMWDRFRYERCFSIEEYRDGLGGLQGSLARAAEAIIDQHTLFAEKEQHIRKAFLSLVRIDEESHYVRKPALWKELPSDIHDFLEQFVRARLLVSRGDGTECILELAHEALLRSWERFANWLKADREFLLWCHRLGSSMAEWERNKCDNSLLLHGPVLIEAEQWLKERTDDLRPKEVDFINASLTLREQQHVAQERQRKRNKTIALSLIGLLFIATLFSGWQWDRARHQSQIANQERDNAFIKQSLFLAKLSRQESEAGRTSNSVLLALEALPKTTESPDRPYVPEAEAALYDAMANHHRYLDLIGHSDEVNDAVFNKEGSIIATASSDKTARLWDTATGKNIITLEGHTGSVISIDISPNQKTVMTASEDGTVRLWNINTGKQTNDFVIGKGVTRAIFSEDGKWALITGDKLAVIRDIETGEEIFPLQNIYMTVFDTTGNYIAFLEGNKVIVKSTKTKKTLFSFLNESMQSIREIIFSPNSQYFIFASDSINGVEGSVDGIIKIWDLKQLKEIYQYKINTKWIDLDFSPENDAIIAIVDNGAAGMYTSSINYIHINPGFVENLYNGNVTANIARFGPKPYLNYVADDAAVLHRYEQKLRGFDDTKFDIGGYKLLKSYIDTEYLIKDIIVDTNGKSILVILNDYPPVLINLKYVLSVSQTNVNNFVSTNLDANKEMVTYLTNKLRDEIESSYDICAISNNKKKAVVCVFKDLSYLVDTKSGSYLGALKGAGENTVTWINDAMFSADDNYLITNYSDSHDLRVWKSFPTTQELINFARTVVPIRLSQEQRKDFFLDYNELCVEKVKQWRNYLDHAETALEDELINDALELYKQGVVLGETLIESCPDDSVVQQFEQRSNNIKKEIDGYKK